MPQGEGTFERAQVLHQQAARLVRLEEPLVGVEADGVCQLDSRELAPPLLRHRREAAVGGVHVEPDAFPRAVAGDVRERVHRAGARGPGAGAHRNRRQSRGAVGGDAAREDLHVETVSAVARQRAHVLRLHAHDGRRARDARMHLIAHVDGGAVGRARRFPRGDQRVDAGRRGAAHEQSARALRVAEPLPDPVDDGQLDLAGTAGGQPRALVDRARGRHEVRQHARPGGRCRNEPEEPRVVEPRGQGQHLARHLVDDLAGLPPLLGRRLVELLGEDLLELAVPGGSVAEIPGALHEQLHHPPCAGPHLLRRHPEIAGAHWFLMLPALVAAHSVP